MKIIYRSLSLLALSIALSCNAMESPTQQDFIVIAGLQIPLGTTELNLSSTGLTELPDSIGKLINLKELNLSFNNLSNLPDSIGNLTNLKRLDLYSNKLRDLPDSLGNLVNLKELVLYSNELSSLPDSIGNLTNLRELNLNKNQLRRFPDSISRLTKLEKLYLASNDLRNLPDSIGSLINLKILDLADNKLSNLPNSIGNLTDLTTLFLLRNQLNTLPDSIGNLTNLLKLDLADNKLSSLPDSIGNLTNLEALLLFDNPIKAIPPSIASWLRETSHYLESLNEKQIKKLVANYNRSIINQFMKYFSAFIHGPLAAQVQNERKLHILIKQMCQAQVDLATPVNDKGDTILHILAATDDPAINYLDEPQVDLTKDRILGLMLLLATECKADLSKLKNENKISVIEVLINSGIMGRKRLNQLMTSDYSGSSIAKPKPRKKRSTKPMHLPK